MSDSLSDETKIHRACISIGSNISPEINIIQAVSLLRKTGSLMVSCAYETQSVGTKGPNFINLTTILLTPLGVRALKDNILSSIEKQLGRMRQSDKNAPRTIDLDIIIFDDQVLDPALWNLVHLAVPTAELLPDLINPQTGETLKETAHRLRQFDPVILRSDMSI